MSILTHHRLFAGLYGPLLVLLTVGFGTGGLQADQMNQITPSERATGWVSLFDGQSLRGWTTNADIDAWTVSDGFITISKPGSGGWLHTKRMFRDFELIIDFLVPEKGDSGIGLRTASAGNPTYLGLEIQILDSHGQAPDPKECGALLEAIVPSRIAVHQNGEWNTYRIRLVGDTLDVWLNDVQIHQGQKLDQRGFEHHPQMSRPLKERLPTGYIALQDVGHAVQFRNIKIKDLSPDPDLGGFNSLFNHQNLKSWEPKGKGKWTVENGLLVGRDGPGHLYTVRQHPAVPRDFELRALVKVNKGGNGGIYFRAEEPLGNPDGFPQGLEAQIDNHDHKNFTGCIYDRAKARKLITRDEAWFDYRIKAGGYRVRTWINGQPMTDALLAEFSQGRIALQTHHHGNEITFSDIRIRPLSHDEIAREQRDSPSLPR